MKKIKLFKRRIDSYIEKMDGNWQELPVQKQKIYTIYFFTVYFFLTAGVIFKVCYDTKESNNSMPMEHIGNPILKKSKSLEGFKDSLSIILKNKINETR